jgi:hypothetical protein
MGVDTSTKLYSYNYINVQVSTPCLVPVISGPKFFYFDSSSPSPILLDASSSSDPLNKTISYSWNCPSYFGGNSCSSTSKLSLTYQ